MVTTGDAPERRWAAGANRYVNRKRGAGRPPGNRGTASTPPSTDTQHQLEATGITWTPVPLDDIRPSAPERARFRFRRALPELVWNDAALEGNNFTLPEVRTLLDGVTVGGRKLSDEQQILALSEAYETLDKLVADGKFKLTYDVTCRLHGIIARHEALDAGMFRGEGPATGGGVVSLAAGGRVESLAHGPGGRQLRDRFDDLTAHLEHLPDPRERALVYFAAATRNQFYFDGNKRTARLMMAGELMSHGYDAVSVPFARRLEFNRALDELFTTNDATALVGFLASCSINDE